MTPPRLHVVPAIASDKALIIRRGPVGSVATLLWDRKTDDFEMGQWLKGRIYEHRCDLSPDGRHMVIFARRKDASLAWTSVSRAPWLRSIAFWPQEDLWLGGGAFNRNGSLWLNGGRAANMKMPDDLRPAPDKSFPSSTDGFHMGDLYASMMTLRGWKHVKGTGYDAVLRKKASNGWAIELSFVISAKNRALISNQYAVLHDEYGVHRPQPDWEWADFSDHGLQFASRGCLCRGTLTQNGDLDNLNLIRDFSDMEFAPITAPYDGVDPVEGIR